MGLKLFKEQLNGKYHGVAPATLLPAGGVSGGSNVRKVSEVGGWKVRKGCTMHNTTAIAAANVLSLHRFVHPRNADYHFLAQCNGSLYDATNDPPTGAGTTFAGSALTALASSTVPGFSDVVGETWLYADGDNAPVMWGGDSPYCVGFLFYDSSEGTYTDYTREVTDNDSGNYCTVTFAAGDKAYIASPCRAKAITFDLGTNLNNNVETVTVDSWQAGAWADRSATDETLATGASLGVDGSMTWTKSASDTMKVINGKMAFWYELTWTGALDAVDIVSIKLQYDPEEMTNKWDGVYQAPLAVRFYDQSAGEYVDYTGHLTNESTSQYIQLDAATTSDELLIKSLEPLCGIGFGVVPGYEQTGNAQIDQIDYWDGDSYNAITSGITDETLDGSADSSFAQTGVVWWNAAGLTVKKRVQAWDSTPGYWYKVTWDAELDGTSNDARVFFVAVANYPEDLPPYKGVIEFKGRGFYWPDPEFPNRLRYSAYGRPDCLSGSDSGYTDEFGDMSEIVAVKRFYNELIVWKANSIWLLEGYAPNNLGIAKIADTVGCCAAKTAVVVETGFPAMHQDEPLSIAIWVDTDGGYVLDGRKPRKVSLPVDQYFNPEFSTTVIAAATLDNLQAFVDKTNNEYHLLLQSTTELVFNYITDEWYPPWTRRVAGATDYLVCGLNLKGTGGRDYTYAGNSTGYVYRLENDTTDKNASNADVAISHSIKSRAISAQRDMTTTLEFTFRKAFIEAKARTSGSVTVNFYKDCATSATELATPASPSLLNTGYNLAVDGVETSQGNCKTFQLEFAVSTADVELELYSFLYQLEARGEFRE